jgi:hypothetical protein
LGNLSETAARVNLAKDVLALANLPIGGTLIVGVTKDYEHVGLQDVEHIDTTVIRSAVEKYVDGDFVILAAEHVLTPEGANDPKRYGIVHVSRRAAQPVLAALDGQIRNDRPPLFRSGDILIRRGAASGRANSGDVRRLLTSSVVQEQRVRAVNELWTCVVEQRRLLGGLEFLYDILTDVEYGTVIQQPDLRAALGNMSSGNHASEIDALQLRVSLVRPHLPDGLYQLYRQCAAFVGRLQMKAIRQRDAGIFVSWTELDNGTEDLALRQILEQLLPPTEVDALWTGRTTSVGVYRPLRPAIDATERGVLHLIRQVLSGQA